MLMVGQICNLHVPPALPSDTPSCLECACMTCIARRLLHEAIRVFAESTV